MDELERQQRAAVVAEALSWENTPYHHEARVKGVGVDCAQFLVGVFANLRLIEPPVIPHYPPDWHLNATDERFLAIIGALADEIEGEPLPGDVMVWRFAKCFAHGAIVIEWPAIIHSFKPRRVVRESYAAARWLQAIFEIREDKGKPRPRKLFSYWPRARRLAQGEA